MKFCLFSPLGASYHYFMVMMLGYDLRDIFMYLFEIAKIKNGTIQNSSLDPIQYSNLI